MIIFAKINFGHSHARFLFGWQCQQSTHTTTSSTTTMMKMARYLTMTASSVPRSLHTNIKLFAGDEKCMKKNEKRRPKPYELKYMLFLNFRVHCIEIAEALDNQKRNISHSWRRAEHGDREQTPNDDTKTQKKN